MIVVAPNQPYRSAFSGAPENDYIVNIKPKQENDMTNKFFDVYIYHANCTDGLTAVGIAVQPQQNTANTFETMAMGYGNKLDLEALRDKRVVFLDFSVGKDKMLEILEVAERVTVIDHHVSVHKELSEIEANNFNYVYDVDKSGAGLAWDYFIGGELPYFVQLVQDRDIWTKKFEDADALALAIRVEEMYFEDMVCHISDIILHATMFPESMDRATRLLIKEGYSYLKYQRHIVKQIASNAVKTKLDDGQEVMKVNCAAGLISDVGSYLSENNKCGVAWMYCDNDRMRINSLRVAADSDYDASAYAKSHGGGGHRRAAGWTTDFS